MTRYAIKRNRRIRKYVRWCGGTGPRGPSYPIPGEQRSPEIRATVEPRGAANPGRIRLSSRIKRANRDGSCNVDFSRLKGGCSQDWLPHYARIAFTTLPATSVSR
jgi:hypothetical protein